MSADPEALAWARAAARAADDKQGIEIVGFDVSEQLAITDIFLVASAASERQVGAIVDAVEEALLKLGAKPIRREGDRQNRWVLLDYGVLVVHVQHAEERAFYALERLWRDCPQLDLELPTHDRSGTPEDDA
ncbi:ribosome-associated protein [Naumannella cuiyingiana]|uniref:Ribosomal silencing factor RsfS n=1 Tax=Naumannella cuiyingiana TaxID=1347891 RepID=A0A7Z0D783_9ACTN|nr:ribosome silencing factor [Naumannella cuiyingiana]NYI70036.1 ribosome-associated protein [Naumannella cuiyingiana]